MEKKLTTRLKKAFTETGKIFGLRLSIFSFSALFVVGIIFFVDKGLHDSPYYFVLLGALISPYYFVLLGALIFLIGALIFLIFVALEFFLQCRKRKFK